MATVRLPLALPIESRSDDQTKDSKSINVLFETKDARRDIIKRPGLTLQPVTGDLTGNQGQGLFASLSSLLWAVIDNVLYKISSAWVSTSYGTISSNTPMISFNQTSPTAPITATTFLSSTSFTVPTGVTSVTIQAVGGGGGGGGGSGDVSGIGGVNGSTGGGGSAATPSSPTAFAVTPGQIIVMTIGAGGSGADTAAGSTGGTTTVAISGGATLVTATGGSGGPRGFSGNAGNGYGGNNTFASGGAGGAVYSQGGGGGAGGSAGTDGRTGQYYGMGGSGGSGGVSIGYSTIAGVPNYIFLHDTKDGYTVAPSGTSAKKFSKGVYGVTSIVPGTGCVNGEAVTFSAAPGGGRTATGTTIVSGGGLIGITVTDSGTGYTAPPTVAITTGTGTAVPYLSGFPDGQVCPGSAYLNGIMYVMSLTGRVYGSDLERPDLWGPLNYITAQAEPDPGIAISKHLNYVVAFGEWSTEFFYDAGNPAPGSALLPNQSARMEIGCASGFTIAQLEQSLIWVGNSKSYGKGVYMLDGLSPIRISTRYIEKYLNADALLDVRAQIDKIAGHTLYILTSHANNRTFVYDVDEKEWYFWTSTRGDVQQYYQPSFFTTFNSLPIAMDDDGGKMYVVSQDVYSDDVNPITVSVVSPNGDSGLMHRKFYRSIELVGDKAAATWTISHSDDDYQSWSAGRTVDGSASRSILYQCGAARRRAWKFTTADNVPIRIEAAEVSFDMGHMEGQTP